MRSTWVLLGVALTTVCTVILSEEAKATKESKSEKPVPPKVKVMPAHTNVAVGATVTLSMVVEGTEPISFQWYKLSGNQGEEKLPWATNASLVVTNATRADGGAYHAEIWNEAGRAGTRAAVIGVFDPVAVADYAKKHRAEAAQEAK
jgi:Immunoglobulin I-set domain